MLVIKDEGRDGQGRQFLRETNQQEREKLLVLPKILNYFSIINLGSHGRPIWAINIPKGTMYNFTSQ